MAEELPVHPLTGLTALGVLSSGRIVWPVLGAAPEGDDDAEGADEETEGGDGTAGDAQDGDGLGDKGREALAKERKARREAAKEARELRAKVAALEAKQAAGAQQDEAQQQAEQTRRDADAAAIEKANKRILAAEVKAAAAGKLADPSDAARYLDLTEFEVGDDGSVDSDAIAEAISDLISKKPYLAAKATGFQGSGDGGARTGGSGTRQVTEAEFKTMTPAQIVQATKEKRLNKLLSGG
jgi:hypothetical protein